MITRSLIVAALLLAAGYLFVPFDNFTPIYETVRQAQTPVGEILSGTELTQHVTPRADAVHDVPEDAQVCFALQFATYVRRNQGQLEVEWAQGAFHESWQVKASSLKDNAFRQFCPTKPFAPGLPFDLKVVGLEGQPGKSATLWLVKDASMGTAVSSGPIAPGMSMALQVLRHKRFGAATILGVANHAFLAGWLCTLLICIVAVLYAYRD